MLSPVLSPTLGQHGQYLMTDEAHLLPLFNQPYEVGGAGLMAPVDSRIREVKLPAADHTARVLWISA